MTMAMAESEVFARSLVTFERQLPELMASDAGRVVVIYDQQVVAVVDDYGTGIKIGAAKGKGYLVAEIAEDRCVSIPYLIRTIWDL